MYVSLGKRMGSLGLLWSRSMSGSQGEVFRLIVWPDIKHKCL